MSVSSLLLTGYRRSQTRAALGGRSRVSLAQDDIVQGVGRRTWAGGIYPDKVGVEQHIGHDVFLPRADFTSRFISTSGDSTGACCLCAALTGLW
jgi:hypothetical protein